MAVTTRTQWAADALINYVTMEIKTLEPELQFPKLGVKRNIPKGYDQLVFPQTSQVATSSVSQIVPAGLGEGVNPTAVLWGATAYKAGPTQYGLIVQVSDLLVRNSAIEVIQAAVRQVKAALMRQIDNAIQTVVNGGSNVIYEGGKGSRAALAAGDIAETTQFGVAIRNLRTASNAGLEPYEGGYYVAIAHPKVEHDLMFNTSTGSFTDVGRYTSVQGLKEGRIGDFRGARVLSSANVQTFSSTVTVYPTTFIGNESFGWGYFQEPEPIMVMQADSNNPLNVFQSIGAKATLGATRFEEARIVRLESAATA